MICNCDFSSKLSLSSFLRQCFLIDVINCIPFTVHTKTSICFYSFPLSEKCSKFVSLPFHPFFLSLSSPQLKSNFIYSSINPTFNVLGFNLLFFLFTYSFFAFFSPSFATLQYSFPPNSSVDPRIAEKEAKKKK